MTRAQLLLAFSAIAGATANLPAGDCDCQKPKERVPCCCVQDDRGLLDYADSLAGRLDSRVRQGLGNLRPLSSLGIGSSCGCDARSKSCDCSDCQSGCADNQFGRSSACDSRAPSPSTTYSDSYVTPPSINQPSPANDPPSIKVPHPVPDSQINPFLDEPIRSGQNRVRGKTVQYRSTSNTGRASAKPAPAPRATYGKQYDPQARRSPTTADYWAEHDQPSSLHQIAPASSNSPTLEEVFRPAYRVSLGDDAEDSEQNSTSRTTVLRPVPPHNSTHRDTQTEPTPVYENPLRQ